MYLFIIYLNLQGCIDYEYTNKYLCKHNAIKKKKSRLFLLTCFNHHFIKRLWYYTIFMCCKIYTIEFLLVCKWVRFPIGSVTYMVSEKSCKFDQSTTTDDWTTSKSVTQTVYKPALLSNGTFLEYGEYNLC